MKTQGSWEGKGTLRPWEISTGLKTALGMGGALRRSYPGEPEIPCLKLNQENIDRPHFHHQANKC